MLSALILVVLTTTFAAWQGAEGRRFNDTGTGTIIFEEAWTVPELIHQSE